MRSIDHLPVWPLDLAGIMGVLSAVLAPLGLDDKLREVVWRSWQRSRGDDAESV